MPFESDKIMFEVYKEATYSGKYRVVYFTELQDHNKEAEINRAMAGEHFVRWLHQGLSKRPGQRCHRKTHKPSE